MALVRTDDATGVTPAFWTPSITKAAEDGEVPESTDATASSPDPATAERPEAPAPSGPPAPPSTAPEGDTPGTTHAAASDDLTPLRSAPESDAAPSGTSKSPVQTDAGQEADSTADTQLLRQVADADAPVFLDTTGRRRRRLRALVWLVGLAGLTYATILVVSLLGGHSTQSLTAAPEFRPGQKQSPPATAAPVATAEAELARPTDATVDTRQTARATADGPATSPAARSPQPGRSGSQAARSPSAAPTASAPTPSASAAVPTPSPSAGVLDGLVDTLFPWAS